MLIHRFFNKKKTNIVAEVPFVIFQAKEKFCFHQGLRSIPH